jgi:hypothetical protein
MEVLTEFQVTWSWPFPQRQSFLVEEEGSSTLRSVFTIHPAVIDQTPEANNATG